MVYKRLINVIATVLGIDAAECRDNLRPNDIESWDSLGHLKLIAALEEEFSIQFDFDEMIELDSIATIRKVITQKCQL